MDLAIFTATLLVVLMSFVRQTDAITCYYCMDNNQGQPSVCDNPDLSSIPAPTVSGVDPGISGVSACTGTVCYTSMTTNTAGSECLCLALVRLFVTLSICLSVGRSSIHPSVRPSVHPSVRPPSVCPSIRSFVRPSVRPSVQTFVRPFISPSVRPSVQPFVCSFTRSSVRSSVHLFIRPCVRPSVHHCFRPSIRPSVVLLSFDMQEPPSVCMVYQELTPH